MILPAKLHPCYTAAMPKLVRSKPNRPMRAAKAGFVLGRASFARISAVEGIALTPDMRATLERFDREGLTAADRRRAILKRFAPSR
jgi:hypothetical protein